MSQEFAGPCANLHENTPGLNKELVLPMISFRHSNKWVEKRNLDRLLDLLCAICFFKQDYTAFLIGLLGRHRPHVVHCMNNVSAVVLLCASVAVNFHRSTTITLCFLHHRYLCIICYFLPRVRECVSGRFVYPRRHTSAPYQIEALNKIHNFCLYCALKFTRSHKT